MAEAFPMSKPKYRFTVTVPVIVRPKFTTMATTREEAKADVCRRLAENGELIEEALNRPDDIGEPPECDIQWDSVVVWLDAGYSMNEETRASIPEDVYNLPILYPPGDPNARTDRERQLLVNYNETIIGSNNFLLEIANRIKANDAAWLFYFAEHMIEAASKPDWNELKPRSLDFE